MAAENAASSNSSHAAAMSIRRRDENTSRKTEDDLRAVRASELAMVTG